MRLSSLAICPKWRRHWTTLPTPSQLARRAQLSTANGRPTISGAMSAMLTIHNFPRALNLCLAHSRPCPPALSRLNVAFLATLEAEPKPCLERASTTAGDQLTNQGNKASAAKWMLTIHVRFAGHFISSKRQRI